MNREKEMTAAEEFRELRNHIRTDVAKIHEKLDAFAISNNEHHRCFQKQLSEIASSNKVNTVKLGFIASGVALVATVTISAALHMLGA